jgi:hypothetical protein
MTAKSKRKICIEVPWDLADGIKKARDTGKRYKGDLFSYPLAFKIGAIALLDIGDEEETLLQEKNDLEVHKGLLDSQLRIVYEQLESCITKKKAKEDEILRMRQDIERLAHIIVDRYTAIKLFKKTDEIGYIAAAFPDKLTKEKLATVFAGEYEDENVPSYEEALKIAESLLYPDSEEVESSE